MSKKDKVDRLINSVKESYENRPPDSSYHITATDEFQEDVGKILNENPDRNVKSRIERAIEKLWFKKFWSPQKGSTDRKTARVGKMHNANIYKMRINKGGRLFFHYVTDKGEGLVPVIYLLGMVINHDKQEQKLREIIGRDELPELVEITEESTEETFIYPKKKPIVVKKKIIRMLNCRPRDNDDNGVFLFSLNSLFAKKHDQKGIPPLTLWSFTE